ncbi:EAL domain-containing protein [Thiomonas sp.]|uniref:bifunctional diguanylate cyclase/phosphodiesterase n=1 Tax=Thiomonas sp. TaxID=2047785 RepID=UPI0026366C81|nr:EAL domain-containing protein [Thiomonas sp.]
MPSAVSTHRLRRLARAVLLGLPLLLMAGWMIWGEWMQFAQAQRQVEQNAARVAAEAAGRIASRLHTQFTELQFAAVALLGPEADPAHPDPMVVQTLRRFMALHPSLYAFNIQAADGNAILWSTQPQPSQPIVAASHFTPLPGHPDFLLGSSQYAARVGTHVLAMRFALRDASGRVRYLVGTPYRVDQLLSLPGVDVASQPWTLTVIDTRNGSVVGQWAQGRLRFPQTAPASGVQSVRQDVAGYPLAVQVSWPFGVVCLADLHGAAVRWSFELGTLILLGLAAWWIARLLDQRHQAAERLRRLSTFNALRADVLHQAGQADTPRALWDGTCHLAVQRAGLLRVWVGGADGGGFAVLAVAGDTTGLDAVSAAGDTAVAADIAAARQAWNEARTVFLPAQPTRAPRRQVRTPAAAAAVAALPLHQDRALVAVLTLVCPDIVAWDDETRSVMRDLAATLEQSLNDITKRQQVRALQRLYQALMHEADVLLRSRDEHDMLRRTCKALIHKTPFHAAWIGLPDAAGSMMQVVAQAGEGTAELSSLALPLHDANHTPLAVRAWIKQRMVFNNDHLADTQLAPWNDFLVRHRWHAALAAPVRRAGRPWGVLVFVSPERGVFDLQTVALCARVAELLGHGLDELDLRERLAQQQTAEAHRARHDALTGLPNRYALEQYLPQAIVRAQRHGNGLAVGMIDLDDFKPVNDTHGHAAGDVLLQQLAQRLQATLRASDFIARLGGDEFVVVFEDLQAGQEHAQLPAALQRLHGAVETPFDLGQGRQGTVGLSLGLALYPGDGDNADSLLRQADAAMYQIKAHKGDRSTWWSLLAQAPQEDVAAPGSSDAYGAATAQALARTQAQWSAVASRFVPQWYAQMREQPAMRAILDTLDPAAFDALQQHQIAHLQFILSPQTSRQAIVEAGLHVGQVHALSGVGAGMLVQMAERYRAILREQWIAPMASAMLRDTLTAAVDTRVLDDLQAQLRGIDATLEAYFAALARPLPDPGHAWAEVAHGELAALGALPGIQAASLLQPDAQGAFQITHSEGPQAQSLLAQLRRPGLQPVADDPAERGNSLTAQAWRTRQIVHHGALQQAAGMQPWREVLVALNLRSAVAIPLIDANGHPDAVLLLDGAYAHQFAASWMRQFAANLQARWAQLIRQRQQHVPRLALAAEEAQARRRRLFGGGLAMWMQPVVDLRTGQVVKAEALARLHLPFGEVLGPADFLPLLCDQELAQLFQLGLEQTLLALKQWDAQGLRLDVSINLPPSLLLDHAADLVAAALQRHGVAAHRLQLELLENQEADGTLRDASIRHLRELGVQLAIDDLGSGYSSLLRLKTLPFDTIKVDQGLVSGMVAEPLRGLALVRSLLQMGRDLDLAVVIEGLETAGLIEMAAVLGARYGQGYGLARPMPAEDLPGWVRATSLPAWQPGALHTAMGALAYHWQFIHDDTCVHPMSLEQCPLTAFLQQQGWDDLAQAHAQFHAGVDIASHSALLTLGLVERVRQSAAGTSTAC